MKIDAGRFTKFLGRVGPFIVDYLDDSLTRPNVLRIYSFSFSLIIFKKNLFLFKIVGNIKLRHTGDDTAQELFTLTYPEILHEKDIQVTSLSWSANGASVVVGYGSTAHEGLCMHKGAVCSWNIERYKINPNKPDVIIETSTCVTAVACHPERPGIVAAGLYNGNFKGKIRFVLLEK